MPKLPLSPVPEQEADAAGERLSGNASPASLAPSAFSLRNSEARRKKPPPPPSRTSTSFTPEAVDDGNCSPAANNKRGSRVKLIKKPPKKGKDPAGMVDLGSTPAVMRAVVVQYCRYVCIFLFLDTVLYQTFSGSPDTSESNCQENSACLLEKTLNCSEEEDEDGEAAEDDQMEEWDTDLEIEKSTTCYDPAGKARYLAICQAYGVVPISYFLRHMKDSELTVKHRGLSPKAAKALALSLTSNTSIVKLNLSDNGLDGNGAIAMAEMLKENCYISELDLSENRVGIKGAEALSAVLRENPVLVTVKLSGNELNDRAAIYLADALVTNQKVEHLDLSHNMLGQPAGEALGVAMAENVGLKKLDLSWNNFRGQGAVAVAKGLGANIFLRVLDLSYNGFGNSGAAALGAALKSNNVLEELHIGNNRIALEGALALALGLKGNKNLRKLKMSRNPIQNEGCLGILKAIRVNPGAAMELLDFSAIVVKQDFVQACEAVQELFPSLLIHHDGTTRLFGRTLSKVS
ncbi:leucine-rich repeat-containing protein 74B [Pseudonaja textilis]|uniref:leucine-rich repeat-containing protein 74B n=1 Tax=Pseudonaja textilis TaxID=8673 RepID=UPI000EAA2AAB|nr:leucine-rich repeat-containing protein 74B [Pseudonaja textilis]